MSVPDLANKSGPLVHLQETLTLLLQNKSVCMSASSYLCKLCPISVLLSGTDEPDVRCLNLAGLSAVPADAPMVAVQASKYTCHTAGGLGAVREFAEHILLQKKKAKSQMID